MYMLICRPIFFFETGSVEINAVPRSQIDSRMQVQKFLATLDNLASFARDL